MLAYLINQHLHQHPEVNLITLQVTLLLERVGESRDL